MTKYPNRIPVIVEKDDNSSLPVLQKMKYLVPESITVGQLMMVIRKRMELSQEKAIFLFVNGTVLDSLKTIGERYDEYMSTHNQQDKYFYIDLYFENTFGFLKFSM